MRYVPALRCEGNKAPSANGALKKATELILFIWHRQTLPRQKGGGNLPLAVGWRLQRIASINEVELYWIMACWIGLDSFIYAVKPKGLAVLQVQGALEQTT